VSLAEFSQYDEVLKDLTEIKGLLNPNAFGDAVDVSSWKTWFNSLLHHEGLFDDIPESKKDALVDLTFPLLTIPVLEVYESANGNIDFDPATEIFAKGILTRLEEVYGSKVDVVGMLERAKVPDYSLGRLLGDIMTAAEEHRAASEPLSDADVSVGSEAVAEAAEEPASNVLEVRMKDFPEEVYRGALKDIQQGERAYEREFGDTRHSLPERSEKALGHVLGNEAVARAVPEQYRAVFEDAWKQLAHVRVGQLYDAEPGQVYTISGHRMRLAPETEQLLRGIVDQVQEVYGTDAAQAVEVMKRGNGTLGQLMTRIAKAV
jgi:hypothetical protein